MIPGPEEWTIVFSKNSTSWGSYFYDAAEDALRVKVKPKAQRVHPLADLRVHRPAAGPGHRGPEVGEARGAVDDHRRRACPTSTSPTCAASCAPRRASPGRGGSRRRRFCLDKKVNLKEALTWAQNAVSLPFIGQENFATLRTLADAAGGQRARRRVRRDAAEGARAPDRRACSTCTSYGRQLLTRGEKEKALKVFELNAREHPNVWPVNVGLARGYAAVGRTEDALKYAKLALAQAPDEVNRKSLEKIIQDLETATPAK